MDMKLADYLNSLNYETFCTVRRELRTQLCISDTAFTNWWKGKARPLRIYHDKINEITQKYSNIKIYDHETEEQI